ncbi:hypothetical protein FQN50_001884 [Emmonsiellopsis sp. PD_5]|nr:hypothetical protein FQN50_001884 [Emmonsiellopsis sp. PD_5]
MGEHLALPSPQPIKYLLLALDHLHSECKIIHSGIKSDNIILGIADDSLSTHLEQNELQTPCPRKELDDGRIIYESRELCTPGVMRFWVQPCLEMLTSHLED